MTGYRVHLCCAAAIFFLIALPLAAQTPSKPKPDATPEAKRNWRAEADQVANEILDNATKMSHNDFLFAYARLCSAYWKADNARARAWCAVAVDDGSRIPEQESKNERQNRVAIAAALLRTVGPLDTKYQQQLQDSLTASLKDDTSPEAARERRNLAENLAQSAAKSDDPAVKAKTLSESLQLAPTGSAVRAIIKMHETDAARADELFGQAVKASHGNYEAINILCQYVLPGGPQTSNPEQLVAPEKWQGPVLAVLAAAATEPGTPEEQRRACMSVAHYWARHLERFSAEVRPTIEAAIKECERPATPRPDAPKPPDEPWPNTRGFQSADDWLKAMQGVRSPLIRAQLRWSAALAALNFDQDLDRGIAIIDDVTEQERDTRPGMFEGLRKDLAKRRAVELFTAGDVERAIAVLDKSPAGMRLAIANNVLEELESKKVPTAARAAATARTYLSPETEGPGELVRTANLVSQVDRDSAANVLRESMKAWDAWQKPEFQQLKPATWVQELEHVLQPLLLDARFADLPAEETRAIAREMQSVPRRSCLQLTLLRMYLDRSLAEQKPSIKAQSAAAADASR